MSNSQDLPNLKQLAKLVKQLNQKDQLRLFKDLVDTLSLSMLENMKTEAEQAYWLCKLDGIEDGVELDDRPAEHFEIKEIKHKHYAYLRWRENGRYKSQYLGPMPFLPGYTYTLINKKNGNTKTITLLGLEIEDNQVNLKVQILKPVYTIRSYPYPECLKTIFSKKEWTIQQVICPLSQREETLNPQPCNLQDATTSPIKPKVREAGESEPIANIMKPEKAETIEVATIRRSYSKPIKVSDSETLRNQGASIQKIPNKLVSTVYTTLKQWENLSQSLSSSLKWNLLEKENKVTLRFVKEDKTIIEYNKILGSVTSPYSTTDLIILLQQIANVASSSQSVDQETKTQAIKLKTRLQGVPQGNNTVVLAYLLGFPGKRQHYSP